MRYRKHWICLSGTKGSGKDTFGEFFLEKGYTKINFGDNLKQMCIFVFDKDEKYFYDPELKDKKFESPIKLNDSHLQKLNTWIARTHNFKIPNTYLDTILLSPRHIMQFIGTDIIRNLHYSYHVESTIPIMLKYDKMICCDVRFENELKAIQEAARKKRIKLNKIFIKRPGFNSKDNHISENSITPNMMGLTIQNDSSIENLKNLAELFIGE